LSCRATGDEPITYSWYKDGLKQLSNADVDYNKPDVVFKEILNTDTGGYSCEVKNAFGSQKSQPAVLHVYGKLRAPLHIATGVFGLTIPAID
jgi:hypothetical protein